MGRDSSGGSRMFLNNKELIISFADGSILCLWKIDYGEMSIDEPRPDNKF